MTTETSVAVPVETLRALEMEFGILMRRLRRKTDERARLVHPDLNSGSYFMLAWIAEEGPVRASGLAEIFDLDKGAVSRHLQQLVELGLVARTPDPADGRATLVSTTPAADARLHEIEDARRQQLGDRLADWSGPELERLVADLARYNRSLGDVRPCQE